MVSVRLRPPCCRTVRCRRGLLLPTLSRAGLCVSAGTARWRPIDRAQSVRMTLRGSANLVERFPERPRYMRRKRYARLRQRALESQAEGLATLERSLAHRLS